MRSAKYFAISALALGAIATSAHAVAITGQLFYFTDPVQPGDTVDTSNAQFDVALTPFGGGFKHVDDSSTNRVSLHVLDFDGSGNVVSNVTTSPLEYFVSFDGSLTNDTFSTGSSASGGRFGVNQTGYVTFVDPAATATTLLQIAFSTSGLSSGGFSSTESEGPIYVGGTLKHVTDGQTGADFSFGFGQSGPGTLGTLRSSTLTASLGNAPLTPPATPEPASLAAVAFGGLIALRRRRRA